MQADPTEDSTFHVAIVLDGHGRWAASRGRPRAWGHRAGARAARAVAAAAPEQGIDVLTLYALPSAAWSRPPAELSLMLELLQRFLDEEAPHLAERDTRLRVLGRRDRLPPPVLASVEAAEAATLDCHGTTLRLAADYSARHLLTRAARALASGGSGSAADHRDFSRALGRAMHAPPLDVDLLVRTGGRERLSDFLLWECAYAELVFADTLWPDFGADELEASLREYRSRDRRFGKVAAAG